MQDRTSSDPVEELHLRARYSFDVLAAHMGVTANQAGKQLRVSGSTLKEYRERGMTERVADRLAVAAGFHPLEVWPEMADHQIAAVSRPCDECGTEFIPRQHNQRFCRKVCGRRARQRPWRRAYYERNADLERARRRAYYAECSEYENARHREYRRRMKGV